VSYGYDGDWVRIWREALWIRGVNPEDLPKGQPEGIPGHFDKEDDIGARIDGGDILVTIASKGGAVDWPTVPEHGTGGSAGSGDETTSDRPAEDDVAAEDESGSPGSPGQTVRDRAQDFASQG